LYGTSGSGYGSRDPIESESNPDPDTRSGSTTLEKSKARTLGVAAVKRKGAAVVAVAAAVLAVAAEVAVPPKLRFIFRVEVTVGTKAARGVAPACKYRRNLLFVFMDLP
jgi:hypothetical protein